MDVKWQAPKHYKAKLPLMYCTHNECTAMANGMQMMTEQGWYVDIDNQLCPIHKLNKPVQS